MFDDIAFIEWLQNQGHRNDSVGRIAKRVINVKRTPVAIRAMMLSIAGSQESIIDFNKTLEEFQNIHLASVSPSKIERLNKEATDALSKHYPAFISGACRIFEIWVRGAILTHEATLLNASGEIAKQTLCPNYCHPDQLILAFDNLASWGEREAAIISPGVIISIAFAESLPPILTERDVTLIIDLANANEATCCTIYWDDILIYFFELLLQGILKDCGWSTFDFLAWCNHEVDDLPRYLNLYNAIGVITPERAIQISRDAVVHKYSPLLPPFIRSNGIPVHMIQ